MYYTYITITYIYINRKTMMIIIQDTLRKEESHHIKRNFHHQGSNHHMICHMILSRTIV